MKYPELADRFKKLREEFDTNEKDCTQDELAKKLYITKTQISELERGKREPSVTELKAYANLFKVPMEYLLNIKNFKNRHYENRGIGKELGLSDKAINLLKLWQLGIPYISYIDILNQVLENEDNFFILQKINNFCFDSPEKFVICEEGKVVEKQEISVIDGSGNGFSLHINNLDEYLLLGIQNEIKSLKKYLFDANISRHKDVKVFIINKVKIREENSRKTQKAVKNGKRTTKKK